MLGGSVHSGKSGFSILKWCMQFCLSRQWVNLIKCCWRMGERYFLFVFVLNLLGINRTICCTEPTWRVFAPVWRNLQQQIPFKQSDHHFSVKNDKAFLLEIMFSTILQISFCLVTNWICSSRSWKVAAHYVSLSMILLV